MSTHKATANGLDRARGLSRTYLGYHQLGVEIHEGPGCRVIRQDACPLIYDANHLEVDFEIPLDLDAIFGFFEEKMGDRDYRQVFTTPFEEPSLAARLSLEGYVPDPTIQSLLTGALQGPPPLEFDIRPVASAADWEQLDRLVRADHVERNVRLKQEVLTEVVTAQMQALRRRFADVVQFFHVWDEGEPVAFFSSWPGIDGVGMVEDLFTLESHRGRGLARALIHHCVAFARAKGAQDILIGAVADDTPRHIYAAMGFTPTCLTLGWLKRDGPSS